MNKTSIKIFRIVTWSIVWGIVINMVLNFHFAWLVALLGWFCVLIDATDL